MSTAARKKININFSPETNKVDKHFFDLLDRLNIKERGDVYRQSLLAGLLLLEKHPNILKAVSFVADISENPTWEQVEDVLNVAKTDQERGQDSVTVSEPKAVKPQQKAVEKPQEQPDVGLSEATKNNAQNLM